MSTAKKILVKITATDLREKEIKYMIVETEQWIKQITNPVYRKIVLNYFYDVKNDIYKYKKSYNDELVYKWIERTFNKIQERARELITE